jgi:folate-binding protein YgfZ
MADPMVDQESLAALYAATRLRGVLVDHTPRTLLRLTGADRVRYLNGQVTCDVRRVRPGAAIPACVTTAKGKLSGVIFVSATADFLRIDADAVLRESLAARLERYIIADDAAIEDTTDEECLLHVIPPADSPAPAGPALHAETHIATRFARPGFDFIAPRADYPRLLETLSAQYPLLPAPLAECLRIEAGVPAWGAELTEDTLPPEAGLDRTAIDYHKGCYIGQEVISRLKSVGHVNRQLTGFTAPAALAAGMTLHPDAEPDKTAGEITSAAWSFGLESWAALGYLKRAFADAALHARSPGGDPIAVRPRSLPLVP